SRSAPTSVCSTSSSRRSRRSTPSASSTSPPVSTSRSSSNSAMALAGLIGRKVGMTQVYTGQGVLVPVTVIETGPCTVVATRQTDRDGYVAAQLGFGAVKAGKLSKPLQGQFAKSGGGGFAVLREFRLADGD